jgi:hypothetical protein
MHIQKNNKHGVDELMQRGLSEKLTFAFVWFACGCQCRQ